MSTAPAPYEHQLKECHWFLSQPSKAGLVLSDAGLGKSVTALLAAKMSGSKQVLVICPSGMGRLTRAWSERFQQWAPERCWAVIQEGPRAADSEPAKCRKAMMMAADCLIVTPELLKHVPKTRQWDFIIVDEIHEFVSGKSAAVVEIRALMQRNLKAWRMGLTATPMTAEPINTWTVLDMFWPGQFGEPLATGKPPWKWQAKWGYERSNEHGKSFTGLRDDVRDSFKTFLSAFSIRTLREDLGGILPPIDVRPVVVNGACSDLDHTIGILDVISKETQHVAAYCWNVERAVELYRALLALPRYQQHKLELVTGDQQEVRAPVHSRGRSPTSEAAIEAPRSVLVATIEAVGVGISLSHIGQYVVFQPIKTAHKLLQLDGRHVRLDNPNAPPAIGHLLFREGRDDGVREILMDRIDAFAASMRTGNNVAGLRAAVAAPTFTPIELAQLLGRSFRNIDVSEEEDTEEESEMF